MKEFKGVLTRALQIIKKVTGRKEENETEVQDRISVLPAPDVLAYLGDALFEIFVRMALVRSGREPASKLHRKAIKIVNATAQAEIYRVLAPGLTPDEIKAFKRGRNAKSGQVPRSTSVTDYRLSTGLESLFGYLLFKEEYGRIEELLEEIFRYLKSKGKLS